MTFDAWLTLVVLAGMVVVLARDLVAPSFGVIGALVVLLVAGVITPAEAFVGFSNPAPITVAALYVLARAVEKTGALQPIVSATLGRGTNKRRTLGRLLVPSAAASAFLNNTPIVAMLVPQLRDWADRNGISPSRFLLPLSYAAILGGMTTLIGTSTNLVISGLLVANGQEPLGMFEITPIGLPIAAVGVALLVFLSPRLLPERRPPGRQLEEGMREFVVSMEVEHGGPLDLRSVETGHLRHLRGVFLVEVEREGERIAPVSPATVLRGGDRLTFVGRVDDVVDLQAIRGLRSSEQEHLAEFDSAKHQFYEAVIGAGSPLVGKTLKQLGFRGQYQAAVVGIHRAGRRVAAKLGQVQLRVGDTMLLLADPSFGERWRERNVFLLVSQLGGTPPAVTRKAWIVGLMGLGIVLSATFGVLPILHAALIGALGLVALGILTPAEARASVDLDVILVIAGAFGLASALQVSGLAETVATGLVSTFGVVGPVGALVGIALVTVVLVAFVTNNATAVLMFPVAWSVAVGMGLNPRSFVIGLAVAASASFLAPIAYQTNLMVYGPGGYRFSDYPRLGTPLVVLVLVAVAVLVPLVMPLR